MACHNISISAFLSKKISLFSLLDELEAKQVTPDQKIGVQQFKFAMGKVGGIRIETAAGAQIIFRVT